jgi:formamidopyrimidine-DNA glycosylase
MPELPEVENIRMGLNAEIPIGTELLKIDFYRHDLRFTIPKKQLNLLLGKTFQGIKRRAKYLLFTFSEGIMISHLGMTGTWRSQKTSNSPLKHDHLCLIFSDGTQLIYNDPRRFGYLDYISDTNKIDGHTYFSQLGPEPFADGFTASYLSEKAKASSRMIKVFLMDQSVVVGIGNIYASEILFMAKIRPQRKIKKIKKAEWQEVIEKTKSILTTAIDLGGSTIRDYRKSDGSSGNFQDHHFVYNRENQACRICTCKIKRATIGGRSTFWCPNCQLNNPERTKVVSNIFTGA